MFLLAAVLFAGTRHALLFALLLAAIGAVPVYFISRRDLTAIDIALVGVALAAAILVSGLVSILLQLLWPANPAVTALRPWVLGAVSWGYWSISISRSAGTTGRMRMRSPRKFGRY